jgi:hypothetical protein
MWPTCCWFLQKAGNRKRQSARPWARAGGQIARELLLESVVLGLAGGALGVGFAFGCLRLLVAFAPGNLPRLDQISIDGFVLLFTLAISALAAVFFGLIPVWKYAHAPLAAGLRDGGRALSHERHRACDVLVMVQVTLALVLLISSGLMIRTFQAMSRVEPGFTRPGEILTMGIGIPEGLIQDRGQVARLDQEIARKLAEVPGVKTVGISSSMTMDGNNSINPVYFLDRPYTGFGMLPDRRFKFISPRFSKPWGAGW